MNTIHNTTAGQKTRYLYQTIQVAGLRTIRFCVTSYVAQRYSAVMTSTPPMYGTSASGTVMVPSAF